ncbi:MAG: trehalose-phosphatase [Alphaproteobacteria bacterium]
MPLPDLPAPHSNWALFLDVDGTLVEIAATPGAVHIEANVLGVLRRLMETFGNAVALISGRSIEAVDELFKPLRLPVAGLHGLEVRNVTGSTHRVAGESEHLEAIRKALREYADATTGILLEDKGATLALHYRQAPTEKEAAKALIAGLLDGQSDYHVLEGKMVLEVKPTHVHKGWAIERLLAEVPFTGRLPVYIGDDVTDEDGFITVNRLGGHSIRIGADGDSAATWRIDSVHALLGWVAALPDAILTTAKSQESRQA